MPVLDTEIVYRLSGGASNTAPSAALGGARSTAAGGIIASGNSQNLFDNVSGTESRDGDIEYRCFFVYNANGSGIALQNAKIWISSPTTSSDDEVAIALSEVAVGTTDDRVIATEGTDPNASPNNARTPLSFSLPTNAGTALFIGDIPAGQHKAIWVRRTVNAGSGSSINNAFTWNVEGESL